MKSLFRIKICGVRLASDVRAVEQSGSDAIGLNFFPKSVRYVSPDDDATRELSELACGLGLRCIGVFVNETSETMDSVSNRIGLDAIQLHGDEPVEVGASLVRAGHSVIRAIKLTRSPFDSGHLETLSNEWTDCGCRLLLDADAGAAHGGSGKTLHWPSVAKWAIANPNVSWTLAGGLRPENVAEAILVSGAESVDTASGVECPRGVKNPERIRAFATAAGAPGGDS